MNKNSSSLRPEFYLVGIYDELSPDPLMEFVSQSQVFTNVLDAEDLWQRQASMVQGQPNRLAVCIYVRSGWCVAPLLSAASTTADGIRLCLALVGEITADARDTFRLVNMKYDRWNAQQ